MPRFLKLLLFSFFVFSFVSVGFAQTKVTYPADLIQLHNNVWVDALGNTADTASVNLLSNQLNEKGEWADIDYTSKQRGNWPMAVHLNRIQAMARAYQSAGLYYYHSSKLKEKIILALNYWLTNDFQNPNWWYPEIGIPMFLAPSLILMEDELTAEQMALGIKILDRAKIRMTGQNKVWLSGNVLLKAMLLRDTETIRKASASIQEELKVSLSEGIQPDGSFHQHGPQIQFGNYGLAYVSDMIRWISILRNTPFQFDESKVSILRNYLLDGQQWITWKNQMDISACGRQLFVNAQVEKAQNLSSMFHRMEMLDPSFETKYKTANQYEKLTGNKHFWRSDFQIKRTPDYYFSVKMCSERVIGAESCNSENIRGYYMGDGASYLYQSGSEYENIFPYWDWKKIPGTTTHQDNKELPVLTASGYRITSSFVGGVSDGKSGIAVMDYARSGLSAKKSWFLFNNQIICLGAGISSSEGFPVTTSVNQTFLIGETLIKGKSEKVFPVETSEVVKPVWILHNKTGYYFPQGGNLKLETKTVEGSWNRVALMYKDEVIRKGIFSLWFEHGTNPVDQTYAYIMIPGATKAQMEKMEKKQSISIIKNDKDLQAVVSADNLLGGAVFYKPGLLNLFGGIEVSAPCVVMISKVKDSFEISVSDPTQKLTQINIKLKGNYKGDYPGITRTSAGITELPVNLPSGDAGKTVNVVLIEKKGGK